MSMLRVAALWLAEWSDRFARWLVDDATARELAIEAAIERHPAKGARR